MKKFLLWVAKMCNVNLVEINTIEKEVEVVKYIADGDEIRGDVTIKGNLTVVGSLKVEGNVSCLNKD